MKYSIIAVSGDSKTGKVKLDKRFATAIAAKDYAESLNTQATKHYAAPYFNMCNVSFRYMMLDRMKGDCAYFLSGYGNGDKKHLWAGDVLSQIHLMRGLWYSLEENEKPDWISLKDISDYLDKMLKLQASKEQERRL